MIGEQQKISKVGSRLPRFVWNRYMSFVFSTKIWLFYLIAAYAFNDHLTRITGATEQAAQ